jgi:AraC-like DNA-binding protein
VDPHECLYEPAAPDAVLCVGDGKTLYIGSLDYVDWHSHGAPVFISGMAGNFRLRCPDGEWLSCRAAVVPAGARHALDLGGDPLAVFYPEPNVAGLCNLARLGREWKVRGQILVGQRPELGIFRELYENRFSLEFAGEALDHLVGFMREDDGPPALDPRIARVVEWLGTNPADLTSVGKLAQAQALSVSRFLHLFTRDIGVPFRRFRIWNRLRAAARVALTGRSLTEAAHSAGFTDSAHFARLHRETFGVTPSYMFRKLARVGNISRPKSNGASARQAGSAC